MWYCEPFGDLQYMRAREILREGPLDFSLCRLPHRGEDAPAEPPRTSPLHGRFD
ncbi:hypothetical protein KL86APRO_30347 [uncultured Alphaproteobacteria bacterium]|uniref:Uncharacterized protein n=1 Tax=uncultured Alphaproteobacteria bacterium TaxID=91750 RepID=A0A212KMA1_9PROT|nr:hypothetical protein KL86APRO_30347 [uncultured Alphaproteobacteria bacterium]